MRWVLGRLRKGVVVMDEGERVSAVRHSPNQLEVYVGEGQDRPRG